MTDRLTFDERHPTSIRLEKVIGGGLLLATYYILMAFLVSSIFGVSHFVAELFKYLMLFWLAYLGYRFTRRFTTTVSVDGDRVTVSSVSILPPIRTARTATIGRDTIVELVPSHGWWIPEDIPAMEGDDVQWFSDIAITTTDTKGRVHRFLVSRDRATRDVMMQRREDVEALLEGQIARSTR